MDCSSVMAKVFNLLSLGLGFKFNHGFEDGCGILWMLTVDTQFIIQCHRYSWNTMVTFILFLKNKLGI
jgi:hypothetical protein